MSKTYVVFIGGTGARALRSLVMLLAAGVKPTKSNEIVPLVIDYDKENADLLRAKEAVERYQTIHNSVYRNVQLNEASGFFSTKLSTTGDTKSIFVSLPGNEKSFADKIGYHDLNSLTKKFINTLYSDWDGQNRNSSVDLRELHLNVEKGFKGNPNVGSAIFNEVFNLPIFSSFLSSITQNDRVFVVGSIFGGTGATGIPQIVSKCRSSDVAHVPIGINPILPYFALEKDNNREANTTIDSDTFYSKTKAALDHYRRHINDKVQEIYYLGYDTPKVIKNYDGGEAQKNEAHIVDMLSAMSIIEFASRDLEELKDRDEPQCYNFSSSEDHDFTLNIFDSSSEWKREQFLYPFKSFGYFWKHYKTNIRPNPKGKSKDAGGLFTAPCTYFKYCFINLPNDQRDSFARFKSTLEQFLFMNKPGTEHYDSSYESWLVEMHKMGFSPFHLEDRFTYDSMINVGKNSITENSRENIITRYDKITADRIKSDSENNVSRQTAFINITSTACLELARGVR